MYLIVTETRGLHKRSQVVREQLTEIKYSVTNKTESFTACALVLRYRLVCLSGLNLEYQWIDDRGGGSPYQHLREIKRLFEFVADDFLQYLYCVRS